MSKMMCSSLHSLRMRAEIPCLKAGLAMLSLESSRAFSGSLSQATSSLYSRKGFHCGSGISGWTVSKRHVKLANCSRKCNAARLEAVASAGAAASGDYEDTGVANYGHSMVFLLRYMVEYSMKENRRVSDEGDPIQKKLLFDDMQQRLKDLQEGVRFLHSIARRKVALFVGLLGGLIGALHSQPAFALHTEVLLKIPHQQILAATMARHKLFYALDYFFATEPMGKAVALVVIVLALTMVGGLMFCRIMEGCEGTKSPLLESIWTAWGFVADSGKHTDEPSWARRLVALPLSIAGMLFFALLVGLMTDAVGSKVDDLRKGMSAVMEENHTLIVGWSPKTPFLVRQLALANMHRAKKRNIVILANKDKVEMDEELLQSLPVPERHGSRVITRRGMPTVTEDLNRCCASKARTILVLSPSGLIVDEADAQVLQTCLVLANVGKLKASIVAEFADADNTKVLQGMQRLLVRERPLADKDAFKDKTKLIARVAGLARATSANKPAASTHLERRIVPVATGNLVMRMMVGRSVQPALASTMEHLLGFADSEFHFKEWPSLVGRKFGEIVYMFEDAVPCGFRTVTASGQPITLLNPPQETIFKAGDKLLVVAEDEGSYAPMDSSLRIPQAPQLKTYAAKKERSHVLICGWRNDLRHVLTLLDKLVADGSEVTLLSTVPETERKAELGSAHFKNIKISQKFGDPVCRADLESLPLETYDKVIVLKEPREATGTELLLGSSASTTALYISHAQEVRGRTGVTIVAELDNDSQDGLENIQSVWLDDAVRPERLQAMVLAQFAEDPDVGGVLQQIVSTQGSHLDVQDIGRFADHGEKVSFWELQARALKQHELIIAQKCAAEGGLWVLNPPDKAKKVEWGPDDKVAVLTHDH